MAVVISSSLVIFRRPLPNPNLPRLCWQSYVNALNTSIQSGVPAHFFENLANPATTLYAQIDTTNEFYIDVQANKLETDFVGVARHNLNPGAEIRVQIEVDGQWFNLTDWEPVGSRQAIVKLFNPAFPDKLRVRFRGQSQFVRLGVLYAGRSITLQRSIYVGHTPVTMGRQATRIGGLTEGGQYAGEIVRRRSLRTSVQLQNLTPTWYRDILDPFIGQADRNPAFWIWRPETYPNEVAYAWLTGDPQPSNQRSNGMMQISFDLEAIT